MPHYQTEDGPRWLWNDFANIVLHTIPVLTIGYNEYKRPEQKSPFVAKPVDDILPPEKEPHTNPPTPLTIDNNDPPF